MTYDAMKRIGHQSNQFAWTDEELDMQIEAINLVICYFEGRGDADLLLRPLRQIRTTFEDLRYLR